MLSEWKYLIFMVIALICNKGLIYDVNEIQENNSLFCLSALLSIVITDLCPSYRHLSSTTPPASTSGESSSASQVLLKGSVVRVFLVCC